MHENSKITYDSDYIQIDDILVRLNVGVSDEERSKLQDILVGVRIYCNTRMAGERDSLDCIHDYKRIKNGIIKKVTSKEWNIIEAIAEETAKTCLLEYDVKAIKVKIEKPGALRFARTVKVVIHRMQDDYE